MGGEPARRTEAEGEGGMYKKTLDLFSSWYQNIKRKMKPPSINTHIGRHTITKSRCSVEKPRASKMERGGGGGGWS